MSDFDIAQNHQMDDIYADLNLDQTDSILPKSTKKRGRPAKKHGKEKKKGKKIKREEDRRYHRYIFKVFKTIHADMQIHPDTVDIVNTMIYDIMEKLCNDSAKLISRTNKKTLTASDIKAAVKMSFPKEIAKHAEMEGFMAVARSEGETVDQQ